MSDNLIWATNNIRTSVANLKKKLSNLKIQMEVFDAELDKIEVKFDRLMSETEIFKTRFERETAREVRRLERELAQAKKALENKTFKDEPTISEEELKISTSIGVFECLVRHICNGAEDFKLISQAFLFPSTIERIMKCEEADYFLDDLPASSELIVNRGRQYIRWIRENCETHLTDPEAWDNYCPMVAEWWKNDALPLVYGSRDPNWDIDEPLTLTEMLNWRDNVGERPLTFPTVFDAYEIYKKNKDEVLEKTQIRSFDLKMFSYQES